MESRKIIPREQDDSKKPRSIVLPAINNNRNINYSAKFQRLKLPHGSGNKQMKQDRESPKRNLIKKDPFENEMKNKKILES